MSAKSRTAQDTQRYLSNKKFAERSFLLIVSKLMRVCIQLFILFLYSRKLSYKDYGLYQSIWLYVNILSVFGLFGLPSIILSSSNNNIISWVKENKKNFLILASILNILPIICIFFEAPEYDTSIWILLILLTLVQNISIIVETIAIKKEKEKLVLISNVIFTVGYCIAHILILFIGYSLSVLLSAIVLIFLLKSIVILYFDKKLLAAKDHISTPIIGKQWAYIGLFDIISIISRSIDKWLILILFSYATFATYYNGSYEIPVFGLMLTAVDSILIVDLAKKNNDIKTKAPELFTNSSLLLAAIVFPCFCFLFFYHQEFFILVFSSKYKEAIPVFLVSIFVLPVRINNFTSVLQVSNRNDLITKGALIDIISTIILMLIFYPILQMRGLALSFVVATYIQCGYYLFKTAQLLDKKTTDLLPIKKLLLFMSFSLIIIGAIKYITISFDFLWIIITGVLSCIAVISILLLYHFKKDTHAITLITNINNYL
jgi:O-antigen/teichoic acid export membrane protein